MFCTHHRINVKIEEHFTIHNTQYTLTVGNTNRLLDTLQLRTQDLNQVVSMISVAAPRPGTRAATLDRATGQWTVDTCLQNLAECQVILHPSTLRTHILKLKIS